LTYAGFATLFCERGKTTVVKYPQKMDERIDTRRVEK
jgi:hypothetical protein